MTINNDQMLKESIRKSISIITFMILLSGVNQVLAQSGQDSASVNPINPLTVYVNTAYENASPLSWDVDSLGVINIQLKDDHQRFELNQAMYYWNFQVFAPKGKDIRIGLRNIKSIYKGRIGKLYPVDPKRPMQSYISTDGQKWSVIPGIVSEDKPTDVEFVIHMEDTSLYLAHMVPYSVKDLDQLISKIKDNPLAEIIPIGKTYAGRSLEIIRVGDPFAPKNVVIRARAHSSEATGSWVSQGIINRLLEANDPDVKKYLETYCVYILPMANKDGVAEGTSRYTLTGMDLNRNWFERANPIINPEDYNLDMWIRKMIKEGRKPDLFIDIHADKWGWLHISRPPGVDLTRYLNNMDRLTKLINENTIYKYGATEEGFRDIGSVGEGLVKRYGIDAVTMEINYSLPEGINRTPFNTDWELLGKQLAKVFYIYFK